MRGEFSGAVGNLAVVDWQVGTVRSALNLSTLGYLYFGIFGQCKSQIWPRFVSSKEILFSYASLCLCDTHTTLFTLEMLKHEEQKRIQMLYYKTN